MAQNPFFPWTHNLWSAKKLCKSTFFFLPTFHPLSLVIFATATVVAFVLLCNSSFNFHCYTQREATSTQKSARKWCCDPSWLLVWKITKGIHSCKPASLNRPISLVFEKWSWMISREGSSSLGVWQLKFCHKELANSRSSHTHKCTLHRTIS